MHCLPPYVHNIILHTTCCFATSGLPDTHVSQPSLGTPLPHFCLHCVYLYTKCHIVLKPSHLLPYRPRNPKSVNNFVQRVAGTEMHAMCIMLQGDACSYSHGVYECWLHPAKYRTQLCKDGGQCRRPVCFFAHSVPELRSPTYTWDSSEVSLYVLTGYHFCKSSQVDLQHTLDIALFAKRHSCAQAVAVTVLHAI